MPFYITDDRVRLYYEVRGTGKPLVLIHGLTANHRFFKKQVPVLAKQFKVITLDLRGHGDSEAPEHGLTLWRLAHDLKELMDYLELESVSVVGWSMGAHVIFEYIKNFTNRGIDKIVIIDMTPKLMKSDDWTYGLTGALSRKAGDFGHEDNLLILSSMLGDWEHYSRLLAEKLLNKSLFNERLEFNHLADFKGKEDLPWLYEETRRNTPHAIVAFWISMSMQDYRPMLHKISAPCLIAYGCESNYYPPENYEYMKKQIPNARVVPFEGCGHVLHLQDPEKFNRMAIDFLR